MDIHGDRPDGDIMGRIKQDMLDLFRAAGVLGFLEQEPDDFFRSIAHPPDVDSELIEKMIQERSEARSQKDWAKADSIREKLQEMGVVLEDSPQGTTWRLDV